MKNYLELPLLEIHQLLKEKKIMPLALINEFIIKIKELKLDKFFTLDLEAAKKEALMLETEKVDNPLFGIPFVVGDNIVTKNLKTAFGSLMLDNFIPCYDATVIQKLKNKKMILLGKIHINEFGLGKNYQHQSFLNNLALLVGKGLLPLSLGSDTGGEIRKASIFEEVIGMKATYGRVSRHGLIPCASSLEQIGPLTKTVYENALLLETISGFDKNDLTSSKENSSFLVDIKKEPTLKRIGYLKSSFGEEEKRTFNKVITNLQENGYFLEEIELPYWEHLLSIHQVITLTELSSNLSRFDGIRYGYVANNYSSSLELYVHTRSQGMGPLVKRGIVLGTYFLKGKEKETYYYKSLALRNKITEELKKIFQNYDYLLSPIVLDLKDKRSNFKPREFLTLANLTGCPALSMPLKINGKKGLGIHIMGDYFQEKNIYRLAYYLEKTLNSGQGGKADVKSNYRD